MLNENNKVQALLFSVEKIWLNLTYRKLLPD